MSATMVVFCPVQALSLGGSLWAWTSRFLPVLGGYPGLRHSSFEPIPKSSLSSPCYSSALLHPSSLTLPRTLITLNPSCLEELFPTS